MAMKVWHSEGVRKISEAVVSVDERYPGAAYIGLAFWLAWSRVACPALWSSAASWSTLVLDDVHSLCIHVVTNLAIVAVIVVAALFEGHLGRRAASVEFLVGGGLVASVGTLGLLISVVGSLPTVWFGLFCAIAGAGMGALLVRCMLLFGVLAPQRVLLLTSASWCLSFVIDILFRAMPPQMAIPVFCLLPLVATGLFGLHRLVPPRGSTNEAPRDEGRLELPRSFWQFVFTVFLVAFVSEMVVYFNSYEGSVRLTSMTYAGLAVIVISLVVMAYAAVFPQSYIYTWLYYPTIFVVMVLLGLLFVLPTGASWSLVASLAACQFFGLLVWCLFSCVVVQSKVSPLRVFGFGFGMQTLGTVIGYVLGARLDLVLESRHADLLPIYLVAAMIVLALSLAVYPPKAMHDLLLAIPDEDAEEHAAPVATDAWTLMCECLANEGALTAREREVMMLLVRGRGSVYISEHLGVTLSTVYTHTRNLYRKFGVHSREELMGLVDKRLAREA